MGKWASGKQDDAQCNTNQPDGTGGGYSTMFVQEPHKIS